ncbi:MAG TPA: DUF6176 family protein [Candidatus Paceibacterota bacterium]|jgi:hypothetical protein|nr:DUF6176 family protein [Candidatus Paceibacterota bacterium]
MITGYFFKIKDNKVETWREWCSLLAGKYGREAAETLSEEGLIREFFVIFNRGPEYFTIGFVEHEGKILPTNMDKKINIKHKEKKKECLEYIGPAYVLYDLEA